MNLFPRTVLLFCFLYNISLAQNPVCPSPYIYMDTPGQNTFIKFYDPSQPLSANNPSNTNIPSLYGGLTLMPNINGGTLCPTFYAVSNGNYHYWNGTTWVDTGHGTGNTSAVNLAGCGSFIYNLVGSTGQVYVYDGTATGTLLTTIQNFSSGGPFDLTTDCDCNFYALKTTTTNGGQSLTKYNPSGVATATWALNNMPNATAGGGFGIIGNTVYLKNNLTNGFFIGTISSTAVTFTQVNGFSASPGDFASCPTCTTPPAQLQAQISSTQLSCYNPTSNLVVTTTAQPVSFSWSGPGITSAGNGSVISINAGGVYTCIVNYMGCPQAQVTLTTSVSSNTAVVSAAITPSGNICVPAGKQSTLSVTQSSPFEMINWSGPGNIPNSTNDTLLVSGGGSYTVQITNIVNGCSASDVVNLVESPSVSISLSSNTLCALPINGSPATVTLTASGATNYTFYPDTYYTPNTTSGSVVVASPVFNGVTSTTGTFVGYNSFCSDTAQTTFSILPNPSVTLVSASICPQEVHTFTASGANTYTWGGVGLSTYFGPTVSASPAATAVYSVLASNGQCMSTVQSVTLFVKPLPTQTITPLTSTICLGASVSLSVAGTAGSYVWSPPAIANPTTGANINVSPPSTQVMKVLGTLNSCTSTAQATVYVQNPPTLSISLSSSAMCYNNFNGSVNSISLVPSGASNYTLLQSSNFAVNNPFGPVMQLVPAGPPVQGISVATTTLIGHTGVCTVSKTQTFSIVPNPTLTVSPPSSSICPEEAQLFQAGGASSFTWQPAPGMIWYSPNSIIGKPKITTFYAVVGSSLGCNSDTRNAVLVVKPVPSVSIVPMSVTVCAGNPVTLVAEGDAETYSWTPSHNLSSAGGATVVATPLTTQEYTVLATLNSCTNSAVSTVSSIVVPVINATAAESVICSGASTQLEAFDAMSFKWTPKETLSFDQGKIVTASPHVNTTYTVWGFNGICTGSTTVLVRTIPRPNLKINSPGGQNAICAGETLELMASGAQNYQWTPPQQILGAISNSHVIVKPSSTTNFSITGTTFENDVVCSQVVSFSVMVVPKTQPLVAGNNIICQGQKTTLEATGGNTFKWSPEDGLNNTGLGRVVAGPSVTTTYTVEVAENTYCGNSTTITVYVNPRPLLFAGNDTAYHVNDAIFLNAVGTGSITWVTGEGIVCPNCAYTQVYPSRNTCYRAQSINDFGCAATDEICLEINMDFSLYVPNSFTPNGDGLNDLFLVYGENVYDLQMEIFDRWGKLLHSTNNMTEGWDGTYRGTLCKPDSYIYKVSYRGLDRKTYKQDGHVSLIR